MPPAMHPGRNASGSVEKHCNFHKNGFLMTENELIEAIHSGIHKANESLCDWSGGLFLSEAAAEGFMVAYMAREIMGLESPPAHLQLEPSIQRIKDESSAAFPGRPCARTTGLARIDLAIFNKQWDMKFAIEAKCGYAWSEACDKDMERLVKLQREFSKRRKETSMQAGIFAVFVHSYSKNGREEAKKNIADKLDTWCGNMKRYQSDKNGINITCHQAGLPYFECPGEGGEVHLATSVCGVVKSK